jgi:hypothetical protein
LRLGTFCSLGRFGVGSFWSWDVLGLGTFCSWDLLGLGRFIGGTLCSGTFCSWDVSGLGRFVLGCFVGAPRNTQEINKARVKNPQTPLTVPGINPRNLSSSRFILPGFSKPSVASDMEFPANWVVLNITDFETAMPTVHGEFSSSSWLNSATRDGSWTASGLPWTAPGRWRPTWTSRRSCWLAS